MDSWKWNTGSLYRDGVLLNMTVSQLFTYMLSFLTKVHKQEIQESLNTL